MKVSIGKEVRNGRMDKLPNLHSYIVVLGIALGEITEIISVKFYTNRYTRKIVCIVQVYGNDFYTSGRGESRNSDKGEALLEALGSANIIVDTPNGYLFESRIDEILVEVTKAFGFESVKLVWG